MAGKITLKNALANLPQKTDVDSIVATDASGNPVYIKKSDLAQVVAELIPEATIKERGLFKNQLTPDDTVSMTVDCDKIYNENNGVSSFFIVNVSNNNTTPGPNGILINLTRRGGANFTVAQYFLSESKNTYKRIGKWLIGSEPIYDEWVKL